MERSSEDRKKPSPHGVLQMYMFIDATQTDERINQENARLHTKIPVRCHTFEVRAHATEEDLSLRADLSPNAIML